MHSMQISVWDSSSQDRSNISPLYHSKWDSTTGQLESFVLVSLPYKSKYAYICFISANRNSFTEKLSRFKEGPAVQIWKRKEKGFAGKIEIQRLYR